MPSLKGAALVALTSASQLAAAWPVISEYAKVHTRAEDIDDEYDYVIVGGGTSGLTVGDRLTENSDYTVLVIEEGEYHSTTGMNPERMYDITSLPNPALNDRTFMVGLGKGVGGSSLVNGQVFLRGTKEEYNAWKTLGGEDSTWDWDGLLPYFRKGVTLTPPVETLADDWNISYSMDYWGTEAKIYASFGTGAPNPQVKVMYDAMAKVPGMNIPVDSGAGETGLYWYTMSQDPVKYQRSYARTGHWDGIERDNYQMIVGSKVNKILFDDGMTATGVTFRANGSDPQTVKARREVILAAGAVHTPQILMLSGIGAKDHLEEAGIDVKINLPGVGSNFQDHSYIPQVGYRWGRSPVEGADSRGGGGAGAGPGVGLGGPPNLATMIGLPVISPDRFEELADKYEKQDPTEHLPKHYTKEQIEGYKQQQKVYAGLMRSAGVTFLEIMLYGPGGAVQNLHCMSRGDIRLNLEDPEGEVLVDYRAGSNPIDLEVMTEIVKFMRRFMTTGELEQYEAEETSPGSEVETDAQVMEWARDSIIPSVFHPVGTTAKMPREWGGVIDEDLLVYGTKKLRIIDSGMMPTTIGATTSMTVYAVAEKAAEIIMEQTFDKEETKEKKKKKDTKKKKEEEEEAEEEEAAGEPEEEEEVEEPAKEEED